MFLGLVSGVGSKLVSAFQGASHERFVLDKDGLQSLIRCLRDTGHQVIGPRVGDEAIGLEPIDSLEDLPAGWSDEQNGGHYRIARGETPSLFGHGPGPHAWRRYLYPPVERMFKARRKGAGFAMEAAEEQIPKYAFLGVRACDRHAMDIQETVFNSGLNSDPRYGARKAAAFIVAINCSRAGGTCFCVSMDAGPRVDKGFDLSLTELVDAERHEFLVEVGSKRGGDMLAPVHRRDATNTDVERAEAVIQRTADSMGREMVPGVAELLRANLESSHWESVAERCLTCGNCTMVCPTCFCTTIEDVTDLSGSVAERWRKWDSCYSIDFSYIHGGSIRREAAARYRQWITHKLSYWHEQFGMSGCVGCGRCITWCPVGIDITEEARAIHAKEKEH